jgi:hypothetical protein
MIAANGWDGCSSVIEGQDDCMLAIEAAGLGEPARQITVI